MIHHLLSRLGARLGNWNDRLGYGPCETLGKASIRWRLVDRIAGRLYVLGDAR